jgi:hypothetical protein
MDTSRASITARSRRVVSFCTQTITSTRSRCWRRRRRQRRPF